MSEFKGTKGEWEFVERSHGQFIMSGNYCIAKVNDHSGNEKTASNAKVMVCALEMLELLQELENDIECFSDINSYGYGNKILELIKKATE